MSDFLAEMADASEQRAARLRRRAPELETLASLSARPLPLAFGRLGVIAEIKPRAPSAGRLAQLTPAGAAARALAYADGGAACVSVLTEPTRFDGSLEHLAAVASALRPRGVPVMRKDFLVDPVQVTEARVAGASGVLLVARMLDEPRLRALLDAAERLALFVLLEAFDEDDLARAAHAIAGRAGRLCLGVNSRDLRTLAIEPARLARLAARLPAGVDCVAESGIASAEDARAARESGYRAVLVGTALMRTDDPAALVRALRDAARPAQSEAAPCT